MTQERIDRIRAYLIAEFSPEKLEIRDDSHLHEGHAGAREGKGHFYVHIVSERFENIKPIERHRVVYQALGDMLETDIHALSVTASVPGHTATSSNGIEESS